MSLKAIIQQMTFINDAYTKWKWRERRVSYGEENPDKTFFVIRRATCKVGLFSLVMTNMGLVKYAVEKGYIPVIDMQSSANTYLEKNKIGKENAWEYYFEQPFGYSLHDIAKSKNIILSNGLITSQNEYPREDIAKNREKLESWQKWFSKYFRVRKDILDEAEKIREELFEGEKTLGVLCRGTDYVAHRPKGHPVQPPVEEMIQHAKDIMDSRQCKWIYLATEDERAYQKFYEAFGNKLKVTNARRCSDIGKQNINDISYERENDNYLRGKEYLINILLLTWCQCLIAGSAGGTYGAMLMGNEKEYQFIYDLGVY